MLDQKLQKSMPCWRRAELRKPDPYESGLEIMNITGKIYFQTCPYEAKQATQS